MTKSTEFLGKRVVITRADNPFARRHVGKQGIVIGTAPLGMVVLKLDEDESEYWAETHNIREAA